MEYINKQLQITTIMATNEKTPLLAELREGIRVIEYSAKAIAIVGDTKAIKDELRKLGGRFNPKLSCGAGWIFSKKQEDELLQLLQVTPQKKCAIQTRCYVGTYGKYNNSSLDGGWLSLSDYETYQDFLKACKELHKNERFPEFMIQDWECLPDGFSGVEWISESDFNDLKQAMSEVEKEQSKKSKKDEQLWAEYEKLLLKAHGEKWAADYLKDTSNLMRSECGVIIAFKKERITTEFCWHDEGPQYEHYKQVHKTKDSLKEYFLYENMKVYNDLIKQLETRKGEYNNDLVPCFYEGEWCSVGRLGYANGVHAYTYTHVIEDEEDPRTKHLIHRMSDDEVKQAIAILKEERAKFEKRLQTYLKRYGVSKLHTWTYWADR